MNKKLIVNVASGLAGLIKVLLEMYLSPSFACFNLLLSWIWIPRKQVKSNSDFQPNSRLIEWKFYKSSTCFQSNHYRSNQQIHFWPSACGRGLMRSNWVDSSINCAKASKSFPTDINTAFYVWNLTSALKESIWICAIVSACTCSQKTDKKKIAYLILADLWIIYP